jgi:hypothetical protein
LQEYGDAALGGLILHAAHMCNITSTLQCRLLL